MPVFLSCFGCFLVGVFWWCFVHHHSLDHRPSVSQCLILPCFVFFYFNHLFDPPGVLLLNISRYPVFSWHFRIFCPFQKLLYLSSTSSQSITVTDKTLTSQLLGPEEVHITRDFSTSVVFSVTEALSGTPLGLHAKVSASSFVKDWQSLTEVQCQKLGECCLSSFAEGRLFHICTFSLAKCLTANNTWLGLYPSDGVEGAVGGCLSWSCRVVAFGSRPLCLVQFPIGVYLHVRRRKETVTSKQRRDSAPNDLESEGSDCTCRKMSEVSVRRQVPKVCFVDNNKCYQQCYLQQFFDYGLTMLIITCICMLRRWR